MDSTTSQRTTGRWSITLRRRTRIIAAALVVVAHPDVHAANATAITPTLEAIEQTAEVVKPPIPPSKAELADSAFKKLDVGGKGYVTRDDVRGLDGFGKVFDEFDVGRSGHLNAAEFKKAWTIYTGNGP